MSTDTEITTAPLQIPVAREPMVREQSLGIHRVAHHALFSPDPAASAAWAGEHLGFRLVGTDERGGHYLAGHGPDHYSLVYLPGTNGLAHTTYIVEDQTAFAEAERLLRAAGVEVTRDDTSTEWHPEPTIEFHTGSGQLLRLTTGSAPDIPVAATTDRPDSAPAPIVADHMVLRTTDIEADMAYARETLGLLESSRIVAPDGIPVMTFFRADKLYHCLALARADANGLHHLQFTLKDGPAVLEAAEKLAADPQVELLWGPVRHGPGHNVAIYFRDHVGHIIEYSAEEETILDDAHYSPLQWSGGDHRSLDEWGTFPPESFI